MSSRRHASQTHTPVRAGYHHPQAPSSASSTSTWEDDAWKIDSDDEEFVKASRGGASASTTKSTTGARSPSTGVTPTHTGRTATARPQRHAPPARPHPTTPLGTRSFSAAPAIPSTQVQTIAESGNGAAAGGTISEASKEPNRTTTADGSGDRKASGQWTLIDRGGSLDGEETVARVTSEPKKRTTAAASASIAKPTRDALRSDLDKVLEDPTEILERLSSLSLEDAGRGENIASTSSAAAQPKPGMPLSPSQIKPAIDASNAVVAVDGVVTNLPAASDRFDLSAIDVPDGSEVVLLSEQNGSGSTQRRQSIRSERRKAGFVTCLRKDVVPMDELRALAWAGVPDDLRPMIWMLLLGYLPPNRAIRRQTLARKRAEYVSGVRNAFQRGTAELDQAIWHQIHIDVPRTNPGIPLWQREATQRALERILYVWAIRHPASGYVQGINDLATPFFEVFLSAYIASDPEQFDVALLSPATLEALEADTFWCLSKLLDGIQDNYIFAQPGIQRQVRRMGELVSRINPQLHGHLEAQGVEYMQFAFRWMNCLLMRELSVINIVRLWDSYLAEGADAFSEFHLFVCAAFLDRWSDTLRTKDFQGIIMFLQSLPTQTWTAKETEILLADAFVKKSLFGGTAHLTN